MGIIDTFTESVTKSQMEERLKPIDEKLDKILEKLERTEKFKEKLLLTISEIHQRQELTLDGYDKIKAMADEWLGQD